jgi:hypothetical protein
VASPSERRGVPAGARLAGILGALLILQTSCGGGSDPVRDLPVLRRISSEAQYTYPLDAYLPDATEQARYGEAFKELVVRCVATFGLTYTPVGRQVESPYLWDPDHGAFPIYNRGAGVVSERRAARFGYHDPDPVAAMPAPDPGPPPSADLLLVVNGSPSPEDRARVRNASGDAVPPEGCYGRARAGLGGEGPGLPDLRPAMDTSTDNVGSDVYAEALGSWVRCMRAHGHADAESPQLYGFRFGLGGRVSPTETELALDDVSCKRTSRVADAYVAARTLVQDRLLRERREELDEYRAWARTVTAAVDAVPTDADRTPSR